MQVTIEHKSGKRSLDVTSPFTRENMKRMMRKSYGALSSSLTQHLKCQKFWWMMLEGNVRRK